MMGTGKQRQHKRADAPRGVADKNRRLAVYLAGVIVGMLGLTAAAVPLYEVFCAVTGFGGTTQTAQTAPGAEAELPQVEVAFKVRKSAFLNWRVKPNQPSVLATPGASHQVSYSAQNLMPLASTGRTEFNVTPQSAGKYLSKIQCFCFTEQTLAPNEQMDMDLVFFIDPAMFEDPDTRDLRQIILNYTYYPVN